MFSSNFQRAYIIKKYINNLLIHRQRSQNNMHFFSSSHPTSSNQSTSTRPLLSVETSRFHALDKKKREEAQGKYREFEDMKALQKRAATFSVDDWREYLFAFAAMGIHRGRVYLSSNRLNEATEIVGQIANVCEHFEPIDYYNFLRLLMTFEFSFGDWSELPVNVQENVCAWFSKNYERLEGSAFFEVRDWVCTQGYSPIVIIWVLLPYSVMQFRGLFQVLILFRYDVICD